MLHIYLSPFEQFKVYPLLSLYFDIFDLSITNVTVILFLIFSFFSLVFLGLLKDKDSSFYVIPTNWQVSFDIIFNFIASMVTCTINNKKSQKFFPIVFFIFMFVAVLNYIGLIPYSFTLTSQLIVTFTLSLSIFIGVTLIGFRIHGLEFLSLFVPAGSSLLLSLLIVPIELISYIFKPVSLSVRLFANMMAGHILLKVIMGFSTTLIGCTGLFFLLNYAPVMAILPLLVLEFLIAFVQSFIFTMLFCMYLDDSLNLHGDH